MADDETRTQPESGPGKRGKLLPIIVGVLMLVEGVVVFGVVKVLGGGAKDAHASEVEGHELAAEEAPSEVMLVTDSFQNMQTGQVWEWKVEIYLRVRQKNLDEVKKIQERDAATIKEGVALIFRRAHDRHLREPGLETITRQVSVYLAEIFGTDADGIPRVDRVIIPECKGFPAD